ncbi:hypothetical protein LTR08_007863 [Meristemomyces frigidus]|nr:hypothetical protein LTR08_007863 [Meristemomyces frigidus]
MARTPPKTPLIAIIGATGTGKSQLAVALAARFNGEVINADAMQLYAGLPIITNKISLAEQRGIPHHLLGCIGLGEEPWVVGRFVKEALAVIGGVRARGRVPVLVGGTHYYTQSVLFRDRLADVEGDGGQECEGGSWPILEQPTEVLLAELKSVDPAMADRWHPRDRRKILRSLEIYLRTGKRASDVYAEQKLRRAAAQQGPISATGDDDGGGDSALRFPTLILWIHAETDVLRHRLDSRVDTMLAAGLLDEVRALQTYCAQAGTVVDETRGIWVSIGYKEFKPYIQALAAGDVSDLKLELIKTEAVERTKIATRQYAKRQALFLLDGSDGLGFEDKVVGPAERITRAFLLGGEVVAEGGGWRCWRGRCWERRGWGRRERAGWGVWAQHVGSKGHRKLVSKRRKREREGVGGGGVEERGGGGGEEEVLGGEQS